MKNWDYSDLSHTASLAGGPEALLKKKFDEGFDAGVKSTRPEHFIMAIAGVVIGYVIRYVVDRYTSKLKAPGIDPADVGALEKAIAEEEQAKDEPLLENLKERLENLKNEDISGSSMDIVTQYVDLFGLSEEDTSLIRIVKDQPDYSEYAERLLQVEPDSTELDVVRAYIEWIRPFEGDDLYK